MKCPNYLLIALGGLATLPAMAASPLTERNISMGLAQEIIAGAMEECTKNSWRVSVVVVDKAGQVAASLRGDGSSPLTIENARIKAFTARNRNQTTLEFMAYTASGDNQALRQLPGLIALGGGVPIKIGNETIGAVGVSGAPGGEKDEICAKAGIARVAASLN